MSRRAILLRTAATVALTLTAAACEAGTEPDARTELDTQAALQDLETLRATLESDDLSALRALDGRTPFGASSAEADALASVDAVASVGASGAIDALAPVGGAARDGVGDAGGRAFLLGLARRLWTARSTTDDGPARGPIISGWHRGTTFVYDAGSDEYRPDLAREGAPETGVRFILYEVDDAGAPIVESEVGYADLIDEGDDSLEDVVLRLRVVLHDVTVLDYRVTLDHDATSGALTVDGHYQRREARLDFDVTLSASRIDGVGRVDLDFALAVDARGLSVVGHVRGIREDEKGQGDVELEVRRGRDRIAVRMSGAGGELDGTVFVGGEPFAVVSGPARNPVITDPAGEPLTWRETLVLRHIVDVVEDVFDFLEDLLDPVDELVVLGIVL